MLDILIKYFTERKTFTDWLALIIDICFAVAVLIFCLVFLFKHIKKAILIPFLITFIIFLVIANLLDLLLMKTILFGIFTAIIILLMIYYAPEIRSLLNTNVKIKAQKQFLSNPENKEELINTLIKTVDHLSSRRVGAIITIEKEHSLNSYIEKSVKLDAVVSFELLDTIFHPNTALHDGAVIIRGNHIMCASAFFPSSDKVDIPQQYGSRHRAAIGISEVTDAFTIVVSEETGKIATTIGGTITGNVSIDSLRLSLGQHIIVQ